MFKDTRRGFGLVTILIHWISAALIIFLFGLGIYMRSLGYYDDWYHKGPELHISLGLLLLFIILVRIFWRASSATPENLSDHKASNLAAKLLKLALYGLLFVVLVSGYLITTAEGVAANMFNLIKIPALLELSADNVDLAGEIHEILAWAIIILAALHAGAALMHHFIMRDRTLVRMLKPVKKSD
jgi:cytochrome b561